MEKDLEFGYVKMCRNIKKALVSYRDKMRKIVKTSPDHNFRFGAHI
jgi:hypothetical protein